jgi:hypothetical protein
MNPKNCIVLTPRILNPVSKQLNLALIVKRGGIVISENYNIREFIAELENKDFFEMIYLLDKEATEAERKLFNLKTKLGASQICVLEYVSDLKNLIFYLRYGGRPRALRKKHIRLLDAVCRRNGQQSPH